VPFPDDRSSAPPRAFERIQGPLDLARTWAGGDRLALIVSGSHAADEAAWVVHAGRPVSLSDLDVYAVVPDAAAKQAALARARAARPGLGTRLLAAGLAAPLEVGFLTPDDLAALPARPGTIALRRNGQVVDGDPAWLARVPVWSARDVSREELWLLLENRAFELLWAAHVAPPPVAQAAPGLGELAELQRRHAVLKCALELAAVMALAAGEYPGSAAERVACARRHRPAREARETHQPGGPVAEPPWQAALDWRSGRAIKLDRAAAEAERLATVRAWVSVWRGLAGVPDAPAQPFAGVAETARRAPLRRRVRRALAPERGESCLESPAGRMRRTLAGTPRHRLNAAAAAALIFEAERASGRLDSTTLERSYRATADSLGMGGTLADAPERLVRAWDRCLLDGQRTEGWR
jgi:hypothetical protein